MHGRLGDFTNTKEFNVAIFYIEYYGTPVNLKSIAQISTPDASSLLIQPYDKSSLKVIEKAIVNSDLGLTPNNDEEVIRLSVPQLTSDRRKESSKVVAKLAEEGKACLIGGLTCVLISVGVCPVWADEELHNLVATNLEKLGEQ
ncbi:hypothetical protein Sjap_002849 [Stephania japonica]|uniref:Ribosome-recycling factor, chloroplastic n=1 Tax=Stephania japonica TaxID=461633 RepID=A0AAP0KQ06_9MAGN